MKKQRFDSVWDAIEPSRLPLEILAQQVIAETAAREWTTDDLYALMRKASPYNDLTRAQFDEVIALVSGGVETGRGKRGADVHWGVAGRLAIAWAITLPAAGLVGGGTAWASATIGGTTGVVVMAAVGAILAAVLLTTLKRRPTLPPPAAACEEPAT